MGSRPCQKVLKPINAINGLGQFVNRLLFSEDLNDI